VTGDMDGFVFRDGAWWPDDPERRAFEFAEQTYEQDGTVYRVNYAGRSEPVTRGK